MCRAKKHGLIALSLQAVIRVRKCFCKNVFVARKKLCTFVPRLGKGGCFLKI